MQQMIAELAPTELREKLVDVPPDARILIGGKLGGMPDLERADLAKAQMRRQPRRGLSVGAIAARHVADNPLTQKFVEPLARACLARCPADAQSSSPVRL